LEYLIESPLRTLGLFVGVIIATIAIVILCRMAMSRLNRQAIVKNSNVGSLVSAILLVLTIANYSYDWSGQWTHFLTIIGIPLTSMVTIGGFTKIERGLAFILGIILLVLVYAFVPTIQTGGNKISNHSKMFKDEEVTTLKKTRRPEPDFVTAHGLSQEAFLESVLGSFRPIVIKPDEEVGPIGNFKGTCLQHYIVSGGGVLEIWTRPDIFSIPVKANLKRGKVLSLGHQGAVAHQFFKNSGGSNITLSLERKIENSCS